MKTKNNDEPLIFAMSLAAGLAVIGLTWHYVMASVMPPQVRMNMWNLTQEAWSYRDNFSAYLVWRFPPMVAEGYPFAFMAAVLPGVLVYGGSSRRGTGTGSAWRRPRPDGWREASSGSS